MCIMKTTQYHHQLKKHKKAHIKESTTPLNIIGRGYVWAKIYKHEQSLRVVSSMYARIIV